MKYILTTQEQIQIRKEEGLRITIKNGGRISPQDGGGVIIHGNVTISSDVNCKLRAEEGVLVIERSGQEPIYIGQVSLQKNRKENLVE